MASPVNKKPVPDSVAEYVDVLIIGAGLSGIGAAVHLQKNCPEKTFALMEQEAHLGGTWALFKYPGIRSDSDMYTLGYKFKPWTHPKSIADGPAILSYLQETAAENGLAPHIHYNVKMLSADWDGEAAQWTATFKGGRKMRCNFLFMCSGYYSYEAGYSPDFPGAKDFKGQIIHPQHWPEDLDYSGKNIAVIGSGATAVTLVPSLAETAAHVTMLQRSPTYMGVKPSRDRFAVLLNTVLPSALAYKIIRRRNTLISSLEFKYVRKWPERAKKLLLKMVTKQLGPDYAYDPNFTPSYNPWDQRICLVPDGDMFTAMKAGKAAVVTDQIERFDAGGIKLESGARLPADIIVTATGLEIELLGGAAFSVDGRAVDISKTYSYMGMMFSGVPNMASVFGYVNASWTLRADLISGYICRLLNHMDAADTPIVTPTAPRGMPPRPWLDFSSGYVQRALDKLPMQGDHEPWLNLQSYARDRKMFPNKPIDDGALVFSRAAKQAALNTEAQSGKL